MEWLDVVPELAGRIDRGCAVVIRTARGEELAEVLMVAETAPWAVRAKSETDGLRSKLVRIADQDDHERAGLAEAARPSRFDECRHLVEDGRWPVELLDVELLLDGGTTVVNLIKSDDFDLTALRAQFRDWFDFEVVLEPADRENEAVLLIPADPALRRTATAGGCGSGGCGCRAGSAVNP